MDVFYCINIWFIEEGSSTENDIRFGKYEAHFVKEKEKNVE